MLTLIPMASFAAGPKMSGFIDTGFVLSDGTTAAGVPSQLEMRYFTSAELDFELDAGSKANVRLDVDFPDFGGTNIAVVEQAYAAFSVDTKTKLSVGIMNNPFGWEKQDAPDMYTISAGLIAWFWDDQTSRDGNNIQGTLVEHNAGDFKIFGGIVNDLGYVPEEISILIGVTASPVRNLEITGGLVTMDDTAAAAAGNIINVNATWKNGPLMVGGELIMPGQFVDQGLGVLGNYKVNREFSVTGRYNMLNFEAPGTDSVSSVTFAGLYELDKNIFINGEFASIDDATNATGLGDGAIISLELLGTF